MTKQRHPIPIGIDDFKDLIEQNYCFIDKPMFTNAILNGDAKVSLITRPRRFGKTLNMSMLRYFLDCDIASSENLFKNLAIEKNSALCSQFMNKYPTIFLSFKGLEFENKEIFCTKLNLYFKTIFDKFRYLLDSKTTSPDLREDLSILLAGQANAQLLQISLKLLTMLLKQHHGKKVFILIDEYDAPIHS